MPSGKPPPEDKDLPNTLANIEKASNPGSTL